MPHVSRIPSSAATTNATVAKAGPGQLRRAIAYNSNAAARYLKIYNKSTAPTVGTDTPVYTLPLAPTSTIAIPFTDSENFSLGISYALTTGAADSDATAVGAGEILGLNIEWA